MGNIVTLAVAKNIGVALPVGNGVSVPVAFTAGSGVMLIDRVKTTVGNAVGLTLGSVVEYAVVVGLGTKLAVDVAV